MYSLGDILPLMNRDRRFINLGISIFTQEFTQILTFEIMYWIIIDICEERVITTTSIILSLFYHFCYSRPIFFSSSSDYHFAPRPWRVILSHPIYASVLFFFLSIKIKKKK